MKESKKRNVISIKYLLPERIVACEGVQREETLLEENYRQAVVGAQQEFCVIRQGGWVLLDFGIEFQGGVDVSVQAISTKNASLRFVFGESVMEALSSIGKKNAGNDHALRDFTRPLSFLSHFRVGNTGFRFVKLEAINADVELRGVQGVFEYRNIPQRGSFLCSDERLNEIWKTAAYTVHLNMQEYVWDGIKRDRLVWIGDMHPEVSTICAVFGYDDSVPDSLDLIKNETPYDGWMNDIPSYTMWWIIIQWDWYMQNGDLEYILQQKAYIEGALSHILSFVKEDGSHTIPDPFVDWSSKDTPYAPAGLQAVMVLCMEAGKKLCALYKNEQLGARCEAAAQALRRKIPKYDRNKQIAALVSLAQIVDEKQICQDVLLPGGGAGLSTFLGYYTLQAVANAGHMKEALDILREYWGAMLDLGATTFWEDFDLEWTKNAGRIDEIIPEGKRDIHGDCGRFCYTQFRHSLCHGWASGPAPFLSHYVLGVKVEEPGCKVIKIEPMLGDLQWAKGTYPTPYGAILIEHRNVNGKVETKVKAPEEVTVII